MVPAVLAFSDARGSNHELAYARNHATANVRNVPRTASEKGSRLWRRWAENQAAPRSTAGSTATAKDWTPLSQARNLDSREKLSAAATGQEPHSSRTAERIRRRVSFRSRSYVSASGNSACEASTRTAAAAPLHPAVIAVPVARCLPGNSRGR